jgi:hypothetical protein
MLPCPRMIRTLRVIYFVSPWEERGLLPPRPGQPTCAFVVVKRIPALVPHLGPVVRPLGDDGVQLRYRGVGATLALRQEGCCGGMNAGRAQSKYLFEDGGGVVKDLGQILSGDQGTGVRTMLGPYTGRKATAP